MESAVEIRRRLRAIEKTRKITGAMQLVASVRVRSVLGHIEYSRRYYDTIRSTMKEILEVSQDLKHPYLDHRKNDRRAYLVIGSDKGMCGSYNREVLARADRELETHPDAALLTVGAVPTRHFKALGREPFASYDAGTESVTLHRARHLMEHLIEEFLSGRVGEVHVVYTVYRGPGNCEVTTRRLLPIRMRDFENIPVQDHLGEAIFHPSPKALFDDLVPQYLESVTFCILNRAYAAENFMRVSAMQQATQNADELHRKWLLRYHMARQAAITQEIAEVSAAADAQRKKEESYV